ncbi:cytochrome c biogenesis protein ResB [Cellulomonas chengniuliangii]|uniref:Cytochrome c biogenesis protein ResB n=1 Tax=Cellulomonas chengniuliangii TaxID=2968084 RepID=A0ABY5KWQ0_9CELL|nr:cytochrome c biogenesis protein ResB [Cellulomonas chengniuliangii]MCC2309538.1 cytochrome c biogenesis protein ResB [Cellulomonas chengniuliangii]UUI74907.1 cytochrome c biogenesis protein ResB [Cellulomonas chengniuliangii]
MSSDRPPAYTPDGLEDAFSGDALPGDGAAPAALPRLGVVGWLRWAWRQLTSMRVALLLLMLLAVAAVPGSMFPQRPQSPADVAQYLLDHPASGPWLDRIGFFDVYTSAWFSAIYLLLFVSLVGCILPRAKVHLRALRARPPRTPRRFDRFPARGSAESSASPEDVVRAAERVLRGRGPLPTFRTDVREEKPGVWSVSAERGYLRETGNLVFHLALVGLLVSVATGQMLHFRGQVLLGEGRTFVNAQTDYDTFESGIAFQPESLDPFRLTLDRFTSRFDPVTLQSRDFLAEVTLDEPGAEPEATTIKVNHPLAAGGAKVYLQGNGYAPQVVVRDAAGEVAFAGAVPFLPQDEVYTSQGVIKVPDVSGGQAQIGLVGSLLPTAQQLTETIWRSVDPQPADPVLVLSVWSGDLGLDTGIPQNVYQLDDTGMEQAVDAQGDPVTLHLRPGETVELPDGLGTLTFEGVPRFVALDLRYDPALPFLLVFALLGIAGLCTSLFVPRRRVWVRAAVDDADPVRTVVTAGALARSDDVGLQDELDRVLGALPGLSRAVLSSTSSPDSSSHGSAPRPPAPAEEAQR